MRLLVFIPVFYFAQIFCVKSQELPKIKWAANDHVIINPLRTKPFNLGSQSSVSIKKVSSLKYKAPDLPFFCSMEDKCRNRFNIFLKIRAGNDESYMKMIQSGTHCRD